MTTAPIKHFLVIYDIPRGMAHVEEFESDYDAALEAYARVEREHRENDEIEVVLLGSDSKETLRRTHSSYFELSDAHADQMVARELADLGLR